MKKILLIEDDHFLRNLYQNKLKKAGFEIIIAATGLEGLEQAITQAPDIILLDFNLPELNGLGVLKELKNNSRTNSIPVIFLTNISDSQIIKQALDAGAQDYLVKTHNLPAEVIKKIESLL